MRIFNALEHGICGAALPVGGADRGLQKQILPANRQYLPTDLYREGRP